MYDYLIKAIIFPDSLETRECTILKRGGYRMLK